MMIERLHEHVIQELQQNARSESVFVLTAIALNLITMGVNSALASSATTTSYAVLSVTVALVIVVNAVAVTGLLKGKETKVKLLNGLLRMYRDQNVADYYDTTLLDAYAIRYRLLLIGVAATGIASFAIPIIIFVTT